MVCYCQFTSDFSAKKMDAFTAFSSFHPNREEFFFHSCDCGNENKCDLGFNLLILCTGLEKT